MLPDFTEPTIAAFWSILFGVVVLALWKGGAPERLGAGVVLLTVVIQTAAHGIAPPEFLSLNVVALFVDLISLAGFTAIALTADRQWPIVAAGIALLGAFAHSARLLLGVEFHPYAYVLMTVLPSLAVNLLIGIGTIRHMLRVRRDGEDPDFTDFRFLKDNPEATPRRMKEDQ